MNTLKSVNCCVDIEGHNEPSNLRHNRQGRIPVFLHRFLQEFGQPPQMAHFHAVLLRPDLLSNFY
jgi:hypothetical protein